MFWGEFWPQLIATIIGIAIGVPVALWLNRVQERRTEQERRTRIILSLRDEIEVNLDSLEKDKWDKDEYEKGTLSVRLKTETWDAFSDGGELKWVRDSDLLYILSEAYAAIRMVMYLSDKYYDYYFESNPYDPTALMENIDRDLTNKVGFARSALDMIHGYIIGYLSKHGIEIERSAFEVLLKEAREKEVR